MSKRAGYQIRLRTDRFKQRITERAPDLGNSSAARAQVIGMSRAQVHKVVHGQIWPGNSFIAATLLAFADEDTTPGAVFDDLFEVDVIDATGQQDDLSDAA